MVFFSQPLVPRSSCTDKIEEVGNEFENSLSLLVDSEGFCFLFFFSGIKQVEGETERERLG